MSITSTCTDIGYMFITVDIGHVFMINAIYIYIYNNIDEQIL